MPVVQYFTVKIRNLKELHRVFLIFMRQQENSEAITKELFGVLQENNLDLKW